jgi:chromosomal replication initiation ATPase DnaA
MAQLFFNFASTCSYQMEDFIVTDNNQEAFLRITDWMTWPYHTFLLIGPTHSGKTHLATIFHHLSSATFLNEIDLQNSDALFSSGTTPFILDPVHIQRNEESFLHFYNLCMEKQRKLLLTAQSHPIQWDMKLPDLSSRLMATPYATIEQPNDTLIRGILLKRFSDLQITLSDSVLDYLMTHIERSYSALQNTVALLNDASLIEHKKVTLPLVKKVLNL